jgi:hypothetical protein
MKQNDSRNIKIHGLPELGEYGEFGSERGVFYKGRVVEDYESLRFKNTSKTRKRSHSPLFAAILFALFLGWFYVATDMGKQTPDMPRDRSITTYRNQ